MADLATKQFGSSAPTAAHIAAFLGRILRGKSSLNRIGRDPELSAWLRQHGAAGRIADIQDACLLAFGQDRVPSRTGIAAFLHGAGRRGRHGDRRRLDGDPEVAAWLRAEAATHTLDGLRAACATRYGAGRTPSRSALARSLQAAGCICLGRPRRLDNDEEVAAWLRENAPCMNLSDLRSACEVRFGTVRTPGKSTIHRFLARVPGAKLTRRKGRLERDGELAVWVRTNAGRALDGLHAAVVAQFGQPRAPSRSGLHRFLRAIAREERETLLATRPQRRRRRVPV